MPRRRALVIRSAPLCEHLEVRRLLSSIIWINKGTDASDDDNFNATFGADADIARADVQQALNDWASIIQNFNFSSGPNQLKVSISADGSAGFGADANFGDAISGKPFQGAISINRGQSTLPDRGYYLDPHPEDDSEFRGSIVNAYAADAPVGSPAHGKYDLYTVVALEMAHELGLNDAGNELFTSDPNHYLTDAAQADKALVGELWAYNGPDVQALFTTDNDLTQDVGTPIHTAEPAAGNQVTLGGITYYGAQDSDNAKFEIGRRYLPSYLDALVLKDSYAYSIMPPTRNMYATFDATTGNLLVRGGQTGESIYGPGTPSNDTITLDSHTAGGTDFTDVTVQIGNPVPGTGPNVPLLSSFPTASITSITIDGNDGSDTVNVLAATPPVTIHGTSQVGQTDAVTLAPHVSVTVTAVPLGTSMTLNAPGGNTVTLDYSTGVITGSINIVGVASGNPDTLQMLGASATDSFSVGASTILHASSVVTFTDVQSLALNNGAFAIAPTLPAVSLAINNAHATLSGDAGGVTSLAGLSISGGALELGNGALQIHYGTAPDPATAIRAALQTGGGIISSLADATHAIALADAADGTVASLPPQTLLLKLTRYGDANLDGTVNFADLLIVAQHYGQTGANWDQGDFTNDATVGFPDLLKLAQSYGSQSSAASAVAPLAAAASPLTNTSDLTEVFQPRRRRLR